MPKPVRLDGTDRRVIENVLSNFDFQRVRRMMSAVDWGWASCAMETPTQYDLRDTAERLLTDAMLEARKRQSPYSLATGGLEASCEYDRLLPGEAPTPAAHLRFVACNTTCCADELEDEDQGEAEVSPLGRLKEILEEYRQSLRPNTGSYRRVRLPERLADGEPVRPLLAELGALKCYEIYTALQQPDDNGISCFILFR